MGYDIIVPPAERVKEDVQHLKEWLSKQAHLPKNVDEEWLETFLYFNKFSLEKAKFKLDNYYSARTKYPEVLKNRDPTSPENLRTREYVKIGLSPMKTKDNIRIFHLKYEADAHGFDVVGYSKRILMIMDMILLNEESRLGSLISIIDMREFRYLHMLKVMTGLTRLSEIINGGYTERSKAVHLINFPPFAQKVLEITTKHFSNKLEERMHVHSTTKSTLFEMVDEDVVCSDFGGKGPSLAEMEELTQKELEEHRTWFLEQDSVCSNELLRRRDFNKIEELKGSFRKLEVD